MSYTAWSQASLAPRDTRRGTRLELHPISKVLGLLNLLRNSWGFCNVAVPSSVGWRSFTPKICHLFECWSPAKTGKEDSQNSTTLNKNRQILCRPLQENKELVLRRVFCDIYSYSLFSFEFQEHSHKHPSRNQIKSQPR